MKKQYITPATAVIKVETTPIMAGSDPKTYDSENLSQGENPGMEGPITDAGAGDETAKAFDFIWEDDWE
jgi:hypothetical protein